MFSLAEKNLMVIYGTGTRMGLIEELTQMIGYLSVDETDLLALSYSVIEKLHNMTDEAFAALDLSSEIFEELR